MTPSMNRAACSRYSPAAAPQLPSQKLNTSHNAEASLPDGLRAMQWATALPEAAPLNSVEKKKQNHEQREEATLRKVATKPTTSCAGTMITLFHRVPGRKRRTGVAFELRAAIIAKCIYSEKNQRKCSRVRRYSCDETYGEPAHICQKHATKRIRSYQIRRS